MTYNPKVQFINPRPKPIQRVGIYCRVSSTKDEQLKSLSNQISGLTRRISRVPNFKIVDMYVEIQSAKGGTHRSELNRLIGDCQNDLLDVVVLKDVSRLGRDTVETLEAYRAIRNAGIRVIFAENGLDSSEDLNEFILSVLEAVHQADNESRSENIKLGHRQKALEGSSGLYNRKCYGYIHNEEGELIPHPEQRQVVQQIFDWYLAGESVLGIVKLLEENNLPSPREKSTWPKRTIETMLSNEKYMGDVILEIEVEPGKHIMMENNHEGIISRDDFKRVQEEKARRSNLVQQGDQVKRAPKRYQSKSST